MNDHKSRGLYFRGEPVDPSGGPLWYRLLDRVDGALLRFDGWIEQRIPILHRVSNLIAHDWRRPRR